jgi:hypothetical protein
MERFVKCVAASLMGWYLLTPPHTAGVVYRQTALKLWRQVEAFDSASKCSEFQGVLEKHFKQHDQLTPDGASMRQIWIDSVCVESGDPRLTEN